MTSAALQWSRLRPDYIVKTILSTVYITMTSTACATIVACRLFSLIQIIFRQQSHSMIAVFDSSGSIDSGSDYKNHIGNREHFFLDILNQCLDSRTRL